MSARWACSKKLAEILSDDPVLAVGTVLPTPPGDKQRDNEYVFVTGTEGSFIAGPSAGNTRLINDDEFTINLELMTRHRGTLDDCMARIEEMAAAVYRLVSASGNLDALETEDWSVTEARPGALSMTPYQDPEGPWAYATLGVDVEVRHYGGNP